MPKRKDHEYLDWLSYQRSWLDGEFSEYVAGVGRNIACHNRRAGDAGTGYKPLFCATPMTFKQHQLQSTKGELACIMRYRNKWLSNEMTVKDAKAMFDQAANHYLNKWRGRDGKNL